MRILWHSNSPWSPSGYGTQTNTFLWRLKDLGHEIACSCFFGLQGGIMRLKDIPFLPAGNAMYGADTLAADASWWQADIVITLMDTWVLPNEATQNFRWTPWFPVDHDPVPPAVLDSLKTAYAPIAYSKFGVKALQEKGIEALYVPHGIDTQLYKPIDKAEVRKDVKIDEDRFVVGIVAANQGSPSRKCFDEQIRAFAIFQKRHPDALLYLHTYCSNPGGENIWGILEDADVPVTALKVVDQYQYFRGMIATETMSRVYSMMDVMLNVARGEGFGVPIAEAQACGVPVIVGNYSSMPELVGAGWTVEPTARFRNQDSYQWLPSVDGIVEALERAYAAKGNELLRKQAREFIVTNYDADMVTRVYWKPTLDMLAARIEGDKNKSKKRANGNKPKRAKRENSALIRYQTAHIP